MQKLALLEAILLDGTLCDSDPFHFLAFRELLQKVCDFVLLASPLSPAAAAMGPAPTV
jgi:beta-phosphoglucomutase-like phosphatase (HAD superfamily)